MPQIVIRSAQPADRKAVLAFCEKTWEWGDYIHEMWENWLQHPQGFLLVATLERQPVGIAYFHMTTPTDAWLEGLRVDPAHRRQGVGQALTNALLLQAKQHGATCARLLIRSNNLAAQKVVNNAQTERISAFVSYLAPQLPAHEMPSIDTQIQLATSTERDTIARYLNASRTYAFTRKLYYRNFIGYPITPELLEEKIAAQHVYLLYRQQRLEGLALAESAVDCQKHHFSIGYSDATGEETLYLLACDLRRRTSQLNIASAHIYAPDLPHIQQALSRAGYTSDGSTFYIYEQNLH